MKEIMNILTTDLFRKIISRKGLQTSQLNAAISLLIKAGIPFDVSYSPGTARVAAQAQLTIYVKSGVTIGFALSFDTGELIFNNP